MVRNVAPTRNLRPGYTVIYPNRDKAGSKATKLVVVVLLLVSAGLMLIVTVGGWSKLQGMTPVNIALILLYLVAAWSVARWTRGALALAAAMGILMLILALIAGTGLNGISWFDRTHPGYALPKWIFGGTGLSPDVLGTLTLLIAPVQALLIFFSMQGFSQGWNIEKEVPEDEAKQRGDRASPSSSAEPAPA
jgi:hypothetical protein